jgi:7-carboxy-7-deazaguanine synthase
MGHIEKPPGEIISSNKLRVNTVYSSWDGESNCFGIGAPTIFVRMQGCPYRCYKKTMGILCDTPEALEMTKGGTLYTPEDLVLAIVKEQTLYGASKITLTGGDPLAQRPPALIKFFELLAKFKIACTVETSGMLSIAAYREFENVSFVLDYKLRSTGLGEYLVEKSFDNIDLLRRKDFVKFVINDKADFEEALAVIKMYKEPTFRWALGLFWGAKLSNIELFDLMKCHKLLGNCVLNMQTHKFAATLNKSNFKVGIPKEL